ncbi:MAG: sec-independent protein translocase protein TatB [Subtercola sp.]|nr:sec-independent protein translocase protein TatB [Subtercola sp.]
MFGLTFEKLIIIGVVAAFVIGPERLPHYASVLAKFVRQLRDFTNGAKNRMKEEMGPDFDEVEWKKLDPRQYDPRRIIRDALLEDPAEPDAVPVKPSSPMAASLQTAQAPGAAAAMAAGAAGAAGLSLNKDAPVDALAQSLADDASFDDGPGVSLSVPAGEPTAGTTAATAAGSDGTSAPDYLSGRKSEARLASAQPAMAAPFDTEAT